MYTSMALDAGGPPRISYYDSTNKDLKLAIKNSGTWSTMTVDSTGDVGSYNALALKSDGTPCMSYYDVTNKNLKYACPSGAAPTVTNLLPSGTITVGSTTVSADYADHSGTGINLGLVSVTLDGSPVGGCSVGATHVSCPVSGLDSGNHDISVYLRDNMGVEGTASGSFDVCSTEKPTLTLGAPVAFWTGGYPGYLAAGPVRNLDSQQHRQRQCCQCEADGQHA